MAASHEIFLTHVKQSEKTYDNEASRQVQEVQKSGRKHEHYSKCSDKEKVLVGLILTSEHGVLLKVVRHLKNINRNKSTVIMIGETFILSSCAINLS